MGSPPSGGAGLCGGRAVLQHPICAWVSPRAGSPSCKRRGSEREGEAQIGQGREHRLSFVWGTHNVTDMASAGIARIWK